MTAEHQRLSVNAQKAIPLDSGAYLSERQWGTVQEDTVQMVMHGIISL